MEFAKTIGIIAGSGVFPLDVIRNAKVQGLEVIAIAHHKETCRDIENLADKTKWVHVGQLGKIIRYLKRQGVTQAAFAGGISRVDFFGALRLDWRAIRLVSKLRSVRDDALLRGIAMEMEKDGIEVFSANQLLKDSCPSPGYLTTRQFSEQELQEAQVGWTATKGIGQLDIGQMCVAYQRLVIAVEAADGTDATLIRAGTVARTKGKLKPGRGPVVVKLPKPQQDLRLDLPAIGPRTIELMKQSGLSGLVVEAGKCVVLNPSEVIEEANRAGISIFVCKSGDCLGSA